jgi:hypothetical protein
MAYTTIDKPTDYFNTVLYTGNATTPTNITGVGFQPDWVWIKNRNNAEVHILADVVRGANKLLESNTNDAELSDTNYIKGFSSDGFQIGSEGAVNGNNQGHVAWNWLASNTTASNTQGDIASTVSANTTSGFSIVSYTGSATNPSTVGHGLGTAPAMIIVKNRSTSGRDWVIWHKELGGASSTADLLIFTTSAKITSSGYWGSSAPSSTTFGVGNTNNNNANGDNHIAYCFAEKKGFSKFGSYTGNGNADGTFIYTGFSPSFVMVKASSTTGNWTMFDNKRSPFNFVDNHLYANTNVAEQTASAGYIDFLSNGFKKTDTFNNASGVTYIYMAFAENPFVTSTGIPTTAR